MDRVGLGELVIIDKLGPVTMNKCTKGKAIFPASIEILDVDVVVWGGLSLAPKKKAITSGEF